MFIIIKKEAATLLSCWQRTGNTKKQTMQLPFPFSQNVSPFFRYRAAPSQIPCRWPGRNAKAAHPEHDALNMEATK